MNILKQASLIAITLLLFGAHSWADTVSLPLTDDTFIHGVRTTGNYGASDDIFVTSYGPKQGLVRFDAASIAGQEVNSATLNLYLNDIAAGGTISIHAITSSWSESTVNWDNQPPVEAAATAIFDLATTDEGSVISIDVTDVVIRWADGSLADAGFLIITTDNIKAYFDAKEMVGGTPATLEVDTGPPAYNVGIGISVLSNVTTGTHNTGIGDYALEYNTTGQENTATGFSALRYNTTGGQNTATGTYALRYNTTGWGNTASGLYALEQCTDGGGNTASGVGALRHNTTGSYNSAFGFDALLDNTTGDRNIAMGEQALRQNNGTSNVAIGNNALEQNHHGSRNTALGNKALSSLKTASDNIAVGNHAGSRIFGGDFNIAIGNEGVLGESHATRIGTVQTRTFIAGIRGVTTDVADGVSVLIDSSGQLGTVSSSRRHKEDIEDMAGASGALLNLRPVTFRYKEAFVDGDKPIQYGLIAEEVAEVFPELVVLNEQNQPETVKYRLLSSLLLNELQKQNATLKDQEVQLAYLNAQVEELYKLVGEVAQFDETEGD